MDSSPGIPRDAYGAAHPHSVTLPLADVNLIDRHLLGTIILLAFATLTCLVGLRNGPPLGLPESADVLASRDALENGRWLIPQCGGEPRIQKPPLGVWAIAVASKFMPPQGDAGVTAFAARLPSAIAAIVTVMAVYWLGAMLYGHRAGLVAGFIAASCGGTAYFARSAGADQLAAMFTTLSFAFFWRGALRDSPSRLHMAGFFVCFGLAMMAHGPLPLVTVGVSLVVYWFFTLPLVETLERSPLPKGMARRWSEAMGRRFRGVRALWLLPGIVLFLIVAGAWPLYVYLQVDGALDLWRKQYFSELGGIGWPIWGYLLLLIGLTFPFLDALPEAVSAIFLPRYAAYRRGLGYVFTWAFITLAFLGTAGLGRPHDFAAVVPALCLMLAPVVDRWFFGTLLVSKRLLRILAFLMPFMIGVFWALGTWYGQRAYPQFGGMIALSLGAAGILWIASGLAFCACWRRSAFALLLLSMPVLLAISAPAIGPSLAHRAATESETPTATPEP